MIESAYQLFDRLKTYILPNNWFSTKSGNKRKRLSGENNENLDHKRFKTSHERWSIDLTEVDADENMFLSRAEKIQFMTNKPTNQMSQSAINSNPSDTWKTTMNGNSIEISSDEDCDNDVIVVSEKRNRPPLMPNSQYTVDGNNLQSEARARNVAPTNKASRTVSQLPLHCSTPASAGEGKISRFCTSGVRRVLGSNSSSSNSRMRQCSSSGVSRVTSNVIAQRRTLNIEVNLYDKYKYGALLQSIMKHPSTKPSLNSSFINLQDVEKRLIESSGSSKRSSFFSPKTKVEIIDLSKPENSRRPVQLNVKSSYSKESDSNSDLEIVSVTPATRPTVQRVNSFENKMKNNKFFAPEWLRDMNERYEKLIQINNQEVEKLQIKKDIYAKQNEKALAPIEERIKRHMTITETIISDEEIEEEPKLPELTPNMLKQIQSALSPHPPSAVVAEGFGLRITRKDMHTLANVNWLNDEVINFYMNLLIERSKKEGLPKVYAFNTFFYPKLIDSGHVSLRRWTRKVDIFAQDLIIVPIHLGVHWCMAIIDFRKKVVEYYDSMGHANNKCLKALIKYLEDERKDKKNEPYNTSDWKCVNMKDIPQQMNGSDCGMFACTFAEYKCRNANLNFSQKEMQYFRKKMVYEILTGKLML